MDGSKVDAGKHEDEVIDLGDDLRQEECSKSESLNFALSKQNEAPNEDMQEAAADAAKEDLIGEIDNTVTLKHKAFVPLALVKQGFSDYHQTPNGDSVSNSVPCSRYGFFPFIKALSNYVPSTERETRFFPPPKPPDRQLLTAGLKTQLARYLLHQAIMGFSVEGRSFYNKLEEHSPSQSKACPATGTEGQFLPRFIERNDSNHGCFANLDCGGKGNFIVEGGLTQTPTYGEINRVPGANAAVLDISLMSIDAHVIGTMLGLVLGHIGTKFTGLLRALITDLAIDTTTTIGINIGQNLREAGHAKFCLFFRDAEHFQEAYAAAMIYHPQYPWVELTKMQQMKLIILAELTTLAKLISLPCLRFH